MPDVRRLRDDLGYFAHAVGFERLFGAKLADWQQHDLAALPGEAPITCLLWGRQMGKSVGLALRAVWRAAAAPERRVLIVSGGGELGARRLLGEVRRLAASELLGSSVVDESASVVRLSSGSEVRCVAASEPAVRGWSVDELLIDEAQLVPESLLLGAALPTTAAREGARVILAGTATVASGAFFDLFRRGEVGATGVRSSRRVSRLVGGSDAAPWQQPSMIEEQLAAMGQLRADAEYRCLWSSGADSFVSRAVLDRVIRDYVPTPLRLLRPHARVGVGADFGESHNRTVFTTIARFATAPEVFGVVDVRRFDAGYPNPAAIEEMAASSACLGWVVGDATGLGGPLCDFLFARLRERSAETGGGRRQVVLIDELAQERRYHRRGRGEPERGPMVAAQRHRARRARSFVTSKVRLKITPEAKAAMYGGLRLMIEQQLLLIPASATELIRELLTLRVDLTSTGAERIEAHPSPDCADSLAMAQLPFRRERGGKWTTRLGELAERHAPEPAMPPELPSLVDPRTPIWQSLAGAEITAPAQLAAGQAALPEEVTYA